MTPVRVKKTTYPNGQLKEEAYYKGDKLHGLRKTFHENGQPDVYENYKDGKLHGLHTYFDPKTGKKKFEVNFVNGEAVGKAKLYDEQGKLVYEVDYVHGKQSGGAVKKENSAAKDTVSPPSNGPSVTSSAETLRPPAGADLSKITFEAKDGSTIILGHGEYKGPIVVRNKALIIKGVPGGKTTLSSDVSQSPVIVEQDGRLVLEGASFKVTSKTQLAVYVNGGSAELKECEVVKWPVRGFYVQSGNLSARQCKFGQVSDVAVMGVRGASLKISNCTFEDIQKLAVVLQDGKAIEVDNSEFKRVSEAILVQQGDPSVRISDNRISESSSKDGVIWIEDGGEVTISDNVIYDVEKAVVLKGKFGKAPTFAQNTLVNIRNGAVNAEIDGTSSQANLNVTRNRIVNPGQYGVLLTRTPHAVLTENIVIVQKGVAVAVQKGAFAKTDKNTLSGSDGAVSIHETAGEGNTVGGDVLIGGIRPQNAEVVGEAGRRIESLLNQGDTRKRFDEKISAVVAAVKPAEFPGFAGLSKALDDLGNESAKLREQTSSFATLKVSLKDGIGQVRSTPFRLFDKTQEPIGEYGGDESQATLVEGVYSVETRVTGSERRAFNIAKGEQKHLVIEIPEVIFLTRISRDKSGTTKEEILPAEFRKKSIMQAIMRDKRARGDEAARRAGVTEAQLKAARSAALAAIPQIEDRYQKAAKKQGELMDKGDWQSEAFQQTRKDIGMNSDAADWAFDILAVAGDLEDAKNLVKKAGGDTNFRYKMVGAAAAIENRLGRIADSAVADSLEGGSTEGGKKIATLAARLLNSYGCSKGKELLIGHIELCADSVQTTNTAEALVGSDDPKVTAAMRKLLSAFLAEKERIDKEHGSKPNKRYPWQLHMATNSAVLNLLAFGSEDDLRQIAKLPLTNNHLQSLFALVGDPVVLLEYLLGDSYNPKMVANIYPALETRSSSQVSKLHRQFFDALVQARMPSMPEHLQTYQYAGIGVDSEYSPIVTFARPSRTVAESVKDGKDRFLPESLTWIPRPWATDRFVKEFVEGNYSRGEYLDYVSHEKLEKLLTEAAAGKNVPYLDLYLAYRRIASRLFQVKNPFPRGAERRAFIVRHGTSPGGAVSGRMDIRPLWHQGSKLRFEITVRFATVEEGGFSDMMRDSGDPTIAGFVGETGRKLISNIHLTRGDKQIEVKDLGVNERKILVFEADVESADLSDLTLHFDLKLYENHWPIDIALYASALSRKAQQH